jgi:hypothetical protein
MFQIRSTTEQELSISEYKQAFQMVKYVMTSEEEVETSAILMELGVDPIDIFILQKLNNKTYGWEFKRDLSAEEMSLLEEYKRKPWLIEGASPTTLHNMINAELKGYVKKDFTRAEVEKRIQTLAEKRILQRSHIICIDPSKLFDNVFLLFLKIPILSPFRRVEIGWLNAVEKIWNADKEWKDKFGREFNLVRLIGVVEGTGEYDVVLLVFTNNMRKVSYFLEMLQREGYIEKSMTQRIWPPGGMNFNPIALPDFFSYARAVEKRRKNLEGFTQIDARILPKKG